MGDSEITPARNYEVGAALDGPVTVTGAACHALQEADPSSIDYVTDSAAAGSGWATGHKTSNGRISTAAGTGNRVTRFDTILERAQRAGFRTGSVTTAEVTDATPAVLDSHINDRDCQGPADMSTCAPYRKENGGPGSIAEQTVDHHVDVILGGGRQRFEQAVTGGPHAGKTVVESARQQGYLVVFDAAALVSASGPRVLGLFNAGTMSVEWAGEQASPAPGSGLPRGQTCAENMRPANEPSLAAMTVKAIDLLQRAPSDRTRGFLLQVEGASIDKQDHLENPCQQIGETVAFDRAVGVGLEFARSHPDTLVIVTADHGHTSQIVPVPSPGDRSLPGSFSTLLTTVDKSPMTVHYGTRAHGEEQDHTGTQVVAAQGRSPRVAGVTDQTDLPHDGPRPGVQ
jgi:alkaline phosphatase/streptomycin-6-phosphatase